MSCFACAPLLTPRRVAVLVSRQRTTKPIPEVGKTTYVYKNLPDPGSEFEENEFQPRRLSYWPPDIGQHRPRGRKRTYDFHDHIKEHITLIPPLPDMRPAFTETAEYPPLNDYLVSSVLSKEKQSRLQWYDHIRQLPTFVQKMLEITSVDRQHCLKIRAWSPIYNNLSQYQNMTRTNVIQALPDLYEQMDVSDVMDIARSPILDAVTLSFSDSHLRERGRMRRSQFECLPKQLFPQVDRCEGLLLDLMDIAMKACAPHAPHLLRSQLDLNPEVQSFWYLRQMHLPNHSLKYRCPGNFLQHSNTAVQFQDLAVANIRCRDQLPATLAQDNGDVVTESFASTKRNPAQDGFLLKRARVTTHARFWPGTDDFDFPFLSLYPLHGFAFREYLAGERLGDVNEAMTGMGLMFSFAWCNSLAFYHGFSPYDELTYPFTTQTVLTDGQTWNFFVYQLNTHAFHGDLPQPTKSNICWTSGPKRLFEGVEAGKLVGVDESVIELFLKFMLRKPVAAQQALLRPHLGLDVRSEETVAENEMRLRRLFGQAVGLTEKYLYERAKTLPLDWIACERNPHAPPFIHYRRAPKRQHLMRLDRHKLTI